MQTDPDRSPGRIRQDTLVSAWRTTTNGSRTPFAWVSLDSGDNDPLLFWSYVLAALDTVVPGTGTSALTLLQSPQPPPIEHVLTNVVNTFAVLTVGKPERDVALVLEDYHVITTPAIHEALAWLLESLPAARSGLRLVAHNYTILGSLTAGIEGICYYL